MKTFNFDTVSSSDAESSTGVSAVEAITSMNTASKVGVGLAATGLLAGAFFLGSWYAGRKADDVSDKAKPAATVAAPTPTVVPATPAPAQAA